MGLPLGLGACPADDAPPGDAPSSGASTAPDDHATTSVTSADGSASAPGPDVDSDTGGPSAWLEAGWGTSEWNAYDGVLPLVVGPQGLSMFSVPLRGRGFYNPPDPGVDNPDSPMLQAWIDVPGHAESPGGHLTEVVDYPALFYPSFVEPGVLEGAAVWLVLPDEVTPPELVGAPAHLHVEMVDADGRALVDDHDLVIGEVPPEPDGP